MNSKMFGSMFCLTILLTAAFLTLSCGDTGVAPQAPVEYVGEVQTDKYHYDGQLRHVVGAHHYQVGPEVVEQVRLAFGPEASGLLSSSNDDRPKIGVQFDLWAANRLSLEQAGVRHIEVSGICTACSLTDWYSHRAEQGRTGRFGAMIGL